MKRFALFSSLLYTSIFLAPGAGNAFDEIRRTREFIVDPPTLHCLSFRWYIYGDDDGDGTVSVEFRGKGEESWRGALPMLRVNREVANWDFRPYASENGVRRNGRGVRSPSSESIRISDLSSQSAWSKSNVPPSGDHDVG